MYTFQNKVGTDAYYAEIQDIINQVTDHMTLVDKVFKANKTGVNMVPVFHCNHSGLFLPADYCKQWGVLYGIGLGPDPVSEVLDTEYHVNPPAITPDISSIEQIMHPVRNTKAQVDLILVSADAIEGNTAILAMDDPKMNARAKIVRANQLVNPAGKLRLVQAAWEKAKAAQ